MDKYNPLHYVLGLGLCLALALPSSAQTGGTAAKRDLTSQSMNVQRKAKAEFPLLNNRLSFFDKTLILPYAGDKGVSRMKSTTSQNSPKSPTITRIESADGTDFWGCLISNDGWTSSTAAYGIYSVNTTNPSQFNGLMVDNSTQVDGGMAVVDGKLYCVVINHGMFWNTATLKVYDTDTWQLISSEDLDDLSLAACDVATDNSTGKVYGQFYDAYGYSLEWGVIDYPSKTRTTIGAGTQQMAAVGITSDGRLYGIGSDGNLYQVSTTDGTETLIGATGLNLQANGQFYPQSGEIDQKTNTFYWMAVDNKGNSGLYTVDLSTGAATLVQQTSKVQFLGMLVPPTLAADDAPAKAKNLTASFEGGSTTGTISFTAPDSTYKSNKELNGELSYVLTDGNDTIAQGSTQPGATVTNDVTLTEGLHNISVTTSNEAGTSPAAKIDAWSGYDQPEAPDTVIVSYGSNKQATISWTAPTVGVHKGYLGQLKYDVFRYSENDTLQLAQGIDATQITDDLGQSNLKKYTYGVVAINGTQRSSTALSSGKVMGKAFDVPYFEDFNTAEAASLWTVINVLNNGREWRWQSVTQDMMTRANFGSEDNDDWLMSPAINLESGKSYKLTFMAKNTATDWGQQMLEVKVGQGAEISAMTQTLKEKFEVAADTSAARFVTIPFSVSTTGEYNIGFHDVSPAGWRMELDSVNIVADVNTEAPDSVTSLKAIAAPQGALSATVSFKAPTATVNGEQLTGLDKITVSRNGQVVKTFNNPAPGSELTFNDDTDVPNGLTTYTVVAYSNERNGRPASAQTYIGLDAPQTPEDFHAEDLQSQVKFSWSEASKGYNGGFVDPSTVCYTLLDLNEGRLSTIDSTRNTSYTLSYNTDDGTQDLHQWAMLASNKYGTGDYVLTDLLTGKPYSLPFKESWPGPSLTYYWYADHSGDAFTVNVISNQAADYDNGSAHFVTTEAGTWGSLNSGKISLQNTTSPELTFSFKAFPSEQTLKVIATTPNHQQSTVFEEGLDSLPAISNWITKTVDLSQFVGYRYIRLNFRVESNKANSDVYLDNVNIAEKHSHDIRAEITSAPAKIQKGHNGEVTIKIANDGTSDEDRYEVKLFCNGTLAADTVVNEILESHGEVSMTLPFKTSVLDTESDELILDAEANIDNDENEDNNVSETIVALTKADVPPVVNLTSENVDGNVQLEWQAPASRNTFVTDGFEDYAPWSIAFGDWTLTDGNDAYGGNFGSIYPNEDTPFAYIIFNPENYFGVNAVPSYFIPFDGNQYAAVPYEISGGYSIAEGNNWLISPLLSGNAQDITAYVHNLAITADDDGITRHFPERFRLYYSTNSTDTTDFVMIGDEHRITSGNWDPITFSVPEGARYFAIQQCSKPDDQEGDAQGNFMFAVDDISFEKGTGLPVAYNVYRDGELIATVSKDGVTNYTDEDNGFANHLYQVTAIYYNGDESEPVSVNVTSGIGSVELSNNKPFDVYTIDGKLVKRNVTTTSGLKPGVYVIGTHKITVK